MRQRLFGLKHNQTPIQFLQEWKQPTPSDKEEIKDGLIKLGYQIIE